MKPTHLAWTLCLLHSLWQPSLQAQDVDGVHPILTDTYAIDFGVFFPDKNFKLGASGKSDNLEIDFNEVFKIDESETTGAMTFSWGFGEKWSLQGQYWTVSDNGSAVLDDDYAWRDVVFLEGTYAAAGAAIDVARVFVGREFHTGPRDEFGAGLGFHWLEIDAYIEGQILTDVDSTELYRSSVSAGAPLPNIGAWYYHSWSPKWAFISRLDWFSASFDQYSGSLWNASVGVDWAPFRHFGLRATWNYFKLDVDVEETSWNGSAEISQNGPFIALTAHW